jgi:hypothetical protein
MTISDEHRPRIRRVVGMLALPIVGALVIAMTTGGQAAAAPTAPKPAAVVQTVAGHGTATAHAADVHRAATGPQIAAAPLTPAQQSMLHRAAATRPALPAKPTVGTKSIPAGTPAATGPNRTTQSHGSTPTLVRPQVAPPVVNNFDGLNAAQSGCGCEPPDPNAAVGANETVEMVNTSFEVYTKNGFALCGVGLNTFFGTGDGLSDPRVMYDNVNGRYLAVVTDVSALPSVWVFATQSNNPCGGWWFWHVGFSGGSFPAGTLVDYPILGQDRNAMLLSTDNFTPGGENFTVFGITKSALYSGGGFSFSAFNTASFTAPATNGGIPMISTGFSYFLGAVPGTGFRLYRLTNSGGPGATLTLQATISSPFTAPPRRVNQPGTTQTLDPLDGRIAWSPINDGNFIWFAHGINIAGFPGVGYGAISIAGNTATVALAYRSGTSDDFNPSVGVGNNPGGGNFIYVNWAYTDTPAGVATSDTIDSVQPFGGVPNLIGTGVVLVNGVSTGEDRFGDYSSVAIDPANTTGSCAVTSQQYFQSGGQWATRIGRVGTC